MKDTIIKAALAWRNDWPDMKDMMEVESGCNCPMCELIRACDNYVESEGGIEP